MTETYYKQWKKGKNTKITSSHTKKYIVQYKERSEKPNRKKCTKIEVLQ